MLSVGVVARGRGGGCSLVGAAGVGVGYGSGGVVVVAGGAAAPHGPPLREGDMLGATPLSGTPIPVNDVFVNHKGSF